MKEILGDISISYTLSFEKKLLYLGFNFLRGIWGHLTLRKFHFWGVRTKLTPSLDSPGRQYIDTFLSEKLPKIVLIGDISVLDVGCGSGYLRSVLTGAGYGGTYTGLDVARNKKYTDGVDTAFKSLFVEKKIEDFHPHVQYDLVVSNTALEHVEDDFAAISNCAQLVKPGGVQVHIVPAFPSLFLYLWHGYRQYNPRRIKKLFNGQRYTVYRLGGAFSFLLHLFWCTIPERLTASSRLRRASIYPKMVAIAQKLDVLLPIGAATYVVVVHA